MRHWRKLIYRYKLWIWNSHKTACYGDANNKLYLPSLEFTKHSLPIWCQKHKLYFWVRNSRNIGYDIDSKNKLCFRLKFFEIHVILDTILMGKKIFLGVGNSRITECRFDANNNIYLPIWNKSQKTIIAHWCTSYNMHDCITVSIDCWLFYCCFFSPLSVCKCSVSVTLLKLQAYNIFYDLFVIFSFRKV